MWQIISTNMINCTILKRSIDMFKGKVWQIISASTLNFTVMFWYRALDSGIVYICHHIVAILTNTFMSIGTVQKAVERLKLKITGTSLK